MTDIMQKIIEAKNSGYRYFGIRTGRVAKIGEELERSHDWDYENDCESEELLDGTCATGFNGMLWFDGEEEDDELVEQAIALNKKTYGGDMQYVIGGYDSEYGNDEQEIIISGATVIAIIG